MTPLFFIMYARSGDLRPYLAPDPVLRGEGQQSIHGSCTCTANHQNDRHRQRQEVELKTFSLLSPHPVHEEAKLVMDHRDRYEHVAKDSKRGNAGEQAEDETQSPEEFRGNSQKCEWGRNVHHAGEEAHCAGESVSTEPSEHLLGAPWAKNTIPSTNRRTVVATSFSVAMSLRVIESSSESQIVEVGQTPT
jgi:hypothetical protein